MLARGVRVHADVWLHCEKDAVLRIGTGTAVGHGSLITAMRRIEIAANVLFGPYVLVMDHLHGVVGGGPIIKQELVARGRVTIEDGVWLGAYVCVLPGQDDLVIGTGSIIGAGSIVTESVPPNSVVVGPKGRIISRSP